jgi:hypothetical protein
MPGARERSGLPTNLSGRQHITLCSLQREPRRCDKIGNQEGLEMDGNASLNIKLPANMAQSCTCQPGVICYTVNPLLVRYSVIEINERERPFYSRLVFGPTLTQIEPISSVRVNQVTPLHEFVQHGRRGWGAAGRTPTPTLGLAATLSPSEPHPAPPWCPRKKNRGVLLHPEPHLALFQFCLCSGCMIFSFS